jgi:hypothetical protein
LKAVRRSRFPKEQKKPEQSRPSGWIRHAVRRSLTVQEPPRIGMLDHSRTAIGVVLTIRFLEDLVGGLVQIEGGSGSSSHS